MTLQILQHGQNPFVAGPPRQQPRRVGVSVADRLVKQERDELPEPLRRFPAQFRQLSKGLLRFRVTACLPGDAEGAEHDRSGEPGRSRRHRDDEFRHSRVADRRLRNGVLLELRHQLPGVVADALLLFLRQLLDRFTEFAAVQAKLVTKFRFRQQETGDFPDASGPGDSGQFRQLRFEFFDIFIGFWHKITVW